MSVVELTYPSAAPSPVLVEVPHAGTFIPDALSRELELSGNDPRRDADLYVDRLFVRAPRVGATLLCATHSRYVVDLNRGADELDQALFDPVAVRRRGAPSGVIWRCMGDGKPLLSRVLTRDLAAERVARFHTPYHDAVASELTRLQRRFGSVLLLAGHSMPSRGRRYGRDEIRPDVVPGSVGGTTAHPALLEVVERHFRDAGLTVRHDDPYRGGYSTQHYARPHAGRHAIQIELNRAVYMDERTLTMHSANAARITSLLEELVGRLAAVCTSLATHDPYAPA